jgi:NAD(P)-dependent dehydrogenase (short-subunit alcohol dehydrogenase family)
VTGTHDDLDRQPTGALLILGGRSDIGLEVATRLAPGRTVVLAARRSGDLRIEVEKVKAAGAREVATVEFDTDELSTHAVIKRAPRPTRITPSPSYTPTSSRR